MNRVLITLLIMLGTFGLSYGQSHPNGVNSQEQVSTEQLPLADKLSAQKMTKGLTTERIDGTPGINYQGGVAGYAGPPRPSDMLLGVPPQTEHPNAKQEEEIAERARLQEIIERQRAIPKGYY